MSTSLEKLCEKHDGKKHVIASIHYPETSHEVKITPTQNGRLGIFMQFPDCEVKEIKDADDFCSNLARYLISGAHVAFDDVGGYFYLYDVIEGTTLREYLPKLSHDCDMIKPLLASVGRQGYCNFYAIWLARLPSSEMGKYFQ